jgi:hypothetical protein
VAHIALVSPRFEVSYWGMEHALPLLGKRANMPVACLPLLAALTPPEHSVTPLDENIEALDFDWLARSDIVGITGMIVQRRRMREVLTELKRRGAFTVVGGPWVTVREHYFGDLADVMFIGEAPRRRGQRHAVRRRRVGMVLRPAERHPGWPQVPLCADDVCRPSRSRAGSRVRALATTEQETCVTQLDIHLRKVMSQRLERCLSQSHRVAHHHGAATTSKSGLQPPRERSHVVAVPLEMDRLAGLCRDVFACRAGFTSLDRRDTWIRLLFLGACSGWPPYAASNASRRDPGSVTESSTTGQPSAARPAQQLFHQRRYVDAVGVQVLKNDRFAGHAEQAHEAMPDLQDRQ